MLHSRSALGFVETPARMPNATIISNLKAQGAPNLVDDVLEIILDHLYSFGNFRLRPDRRSFARYALISRAWRIPTQILLFREVWIRKTSQLESLKGALLPKTRHAKLLAHTVRVLWIRIDGLERVGTLDPDRLPECMKLCPRLYELRLETFAVTRLSEGTLRSLEMTPPIYALQLMRPEMLYRERYEYTELHLQLLQVSHWRLQFFTMEGKYDAAWPSRRLPPVKHQFIEVRFRASTGYLIRGLLSWLLYNSTKSLQILSLKDYDKLLSKLSPNLRMFEIPYTDGNEIFHLLNLPKVEELMWIAMHPHARPLPLCIPKQHLLPRVIHLGLNADGWPITRRQLKTPPKDISTSLKHVTLLQAYHKSTPIRQTAEEAKEVLGEILGPRIEIVVYRNFEDYERKRVVSLIPGRRVLQGSSLVDYATMNRILRESMTERRHPSKDISGNSPSRERRPALRWK
ncbi:hypothetical protein FS842_007358 [Serendipita sp. 407]|nr:hypothetical protein FS842_007358 [Serendipita sp. 407]